jgi:hypothetical protein
MSPVQCRTRASRYRALARMDRANAVLLNRLAEEAERGVLCVVYRRDHIHLAHDVRPSRERVLFDAARFPGLFLQDAS